jgi:exosortase/archaeosortase family protein
VITSLLAANMFLHTTWRRALLVCAVIPLGLLRNGFRILVISLLCVHIGPQMINSVIHRRGGPFFFAASLIPLFLLLWWLRRGEVARQARKTIVDAEGKSLSANAPVS